MKLPGDLKASMADDIGFLRWQEWQRHMGSVPGSEEDPLEENGNPVQEVLPGRIPGTKSSLVGDSP